MREEYKSGNILIRQVPAVKGYECMTLIRTMIERTGAQTILDLLQQAESEELEVLYDRISMGCEVEGQPLTGAEEDAFSCVSGYYLFLYQAAMFNFLPVWHSECLQLNHSPEFSPSEPKMTPPFFMNVVTEGLASWRDLETWYTVVDVAKMNEMMVAKANDEWTAQQRAETNSGGSSSGQGTPALGSMAHALSQSQQTGV